MSENSENFANGISTHNLSHFHITEIKKYQNHTRITKNLSVNFSVISPFYSKNSYSITHKIPLTNPKTPSKNSQTSHKSTVFSESNHFLIIMHSFSYTFYQIQPSQILKSYHSLSHENPVFQANFISSHHLIISQIPKFTETFYHDTYFQSDSHTKKEYIKELPIRNRQTHIKH